MGVAELFCLSHHLVENLKWSQEKKSTWIYRPREKYRSALKGRS